MDALIFSTLIICITVVIITIILKNSLSNLINKAIKFNLKSGSKEINIETQKEQHIFEKTIDVVASNDNKEENNEFINVIKSLEENDLEKAEEIFKNGNFNFRQEGYYNYQKFLKNDNSIIKTLSENIENLDEGEEKRSNIFWLANCYMKKKEFDNLHKLYETEINNSKLLKNINKLKFSYAAFLYKIDDKLINSKELLIEILNSDEINEIKKDVYDQLADIEQKLGNELLYNFCKNKIAEVEPLNKSALFNSAYDLNNKKFNGLQLLTYEDVLKLDSNYVNALNNYGVSLAEFDLHCLSINNYKKSAEKNNTLSMANQGYKLLKAGFIEEAKTIANEALKKEDIHENIYGLLKEIDVVQKDEQDKLNKLKDKLNKYQKHIRKYTEVFYLCGNELNKTWKYKEHTFDFTINNKNISVSFNLDENISNYQIKINGSVNNNTLDVSFEEKDLNSKGLFSLDSKRELLGYLSDDKQKIILFGKNEADNFYMEFTQ